MDIDHDVKPARCSPVLCVNTGRFVRTTRLAKQEAAPSCSFRCTTS